jgi:hypothetical protein
MSPDNALPHTKRTHTKPVPTCRVRYRGIGSLGVARGCTRFFIPSGVHFLRRGFRQFMVMDDNGFFYGDENNPQA